MAMHVHQPQQSAHEHGPFDGFGVTRGRLTAALILITLGIVFLLGQTGRLDYGSSWWVLFIAIPGFVAIGGAIKDYADQREFTGKIVGAAAGGIAALVLSAIFIWDPTWSFTRNWNVDRTFPFLRDLSRLWPWLLVVTGVVLLYRGWSRLTSPPALVGAMLIFVGGVFILNISWTTIWPLLIVGAGIWLLLPRNGEQR